MQQSWNCTDLGGSALLNGHSKNSAVNAQGGTMRLLWDRYLAFTDSTKFDTSHAVCEHDRKILDATLFPFLRCSWITEPEASAFSHVLAAQRPLYPIWSPGPPVNVPMHKRVSRYKTISPDGRELRIEWLKRAERNYVRDRAISLGLTVCPFESIPSWIERTKDIHRHTEERFRRDAEIHRRVDDSEVSKWLDSLNSSLNEWMNIRIWKADPSWSLPAALKNEYYPIVQARFAEARAMDRIKEANTVDESEQFLLSLKLLATGNSDPPFD
ncbi:hypothetical protein BJ742DRAFT_850586 [Cladochytrium replicatum]|nr:hypothetical protein BJ742DRAFT_850586 [Cladochytrium replicatum]